MARQSAMRPERMRVRVAPLAVLAGIVGGWIAVLEGMHYAAAQAQPARFVFQVVVNDSESNPNYVGSQPTSPDGKIIAKPVEEMGSITGVQLAARISGEPLGAPLHHEGVNYLVFSPDSRTVLTAGGTGRLWDAATGRPIGEPLRHEVGGVGTIAFSPDGKLALTAGYSRSGGVARLWDAATGKLVRELTHKEQ